MYLREDIKWKEKEKSFYVNRKISREITCIERKIDWAFKTVGNFTFCDGCGFVVGCGMGKKLKGTKKFFLEG